jgi:hypothetical protein
MTYQTRIACVAYFKTHFKTQAKGVVIIHGKGGVGKWEGEGKRSFTLINRGGAKHFYRRERGAVKKVFNINTMSETFSDRKFFYLKHELSTAVCSLRQVK